MPLFEYACDRCDLEFATLIRSGETPECPSCQGTELKRRLSVFAAHTKGEETPSSMPTATACGACGDPRGPGACSLN